MGKLIILMGLPGSGKSSYAKEYLENPANAASTVWCSSDNMRKKLYGDENIQGDPQKVFGALHADVTEYLKAGYNVIYDATNVTRKSRKTVINIAKNLRNLDVQIHGVIIWAPIEDCIKRDALRDRTVGVGVIDKFIRRWQAPYYTEGFDTLEIIYNSNLDADEYTEKLRTSMNIHHDNPHHSLDVLAHCENSCELMKRIASDNTDLQFIMNWHDCGKPYTKFFDEKNPAVAHYYDHQAVGSYMIYGVLPTIKNINMNRIAFISWAISTHMEPFFNSSYYHSLDKYLKEMIDLIHKCDLDAH